MLAAIQMPARQNIIVGQQQRQIGEKRNKEKWQAMLSYYAIALFIYFISLMG